MKRLPILIKKNFKLIMRSKGSALIIILGPLLLITLIGAAFNTASIYGIRVGTFSEEYSPLSEAIIHELNQNNYATQKASSEINCIDGVRNGVFHVCAIFPPNLKVAGGGNIQFYVDNTRTNIVYLISETISSQIGKKSQALSTQLTKGVVDTLKDIEEEIKDRELLLQEIKTANEEELATFKVVISDLQEMKLDYNIDNIPLSTLESQISNTSLGLSAFKVVEKDIEDIVADTSAASVKRSKALEKLTVLQVNAESTKFSVSNIQSTFNLIKKDIEAIKETGVGKIVDPLKSEIKPIAAQKTHINFIFPTLLAMIIMFVSMLLTSTLEIKERASKVYFKNFITPTSQTLFTLSNYITNMVIVLIQVTLLLVAATFFFFEGILASLPLLIPALLIITSIFLLLGITLGTIFRTEETSTITVISLGFIFIFFSSAILPIETLPSVIKNIASFNPFYIAEILLNKIILFQASLKSVADQFLMLGSYLVGVIAITAIAKKTTKRKQ